jgi:hypothetical protein
MKTCRGVEVELRHSCDLDYRWDWPGSRPGRFTPGEIVLDTNWIGSWVGPTAGLDVVEERKNLSLPGLEPRPSSPKPVAIPSYPGS